MCMQGCCITAQAELVPVCVVKQVCARFTLYLGRPRVSCFGFLGAGAPVGASTQVIPLLCPEMAHRCLSTNQPT